MSTSARTSSPHRQGIDLARFIAAFGVVAAHALASPRDWAGHLALALFLILTGFLAVQSAQRAGGTYAFWPRAQRLLVPWLAWSAFFRVLDLVISDSPDRFIPLSNPWSLLYGSYIHLWFLPFVGLAMALVGPVTKWLTTADRLLLACLLLLGVSAPLFWAHESLAMPEPLPQWAFALPCYALGLFLGVAKPMGRANMVLLTGVLLTGMAIWLGGAAPWTLTLLVGVAGFELFWRLPLRGGWLPPLGRVAFGIYLAHPFFMLVIYKFIGPDVAPTLGAVLAFLLTWAAIAILRHIPLFARIT